MKENLARKKYTIQSEFINGLPHIYLFEHTEDSSLTNYRMNQTFIPFSLDWDAIEDEINEKEYLGKSSHLTKVNDKLILSIRQPGARERKIEFVKEPSVNRTITLLKGVINENVTKLKEEILQKFFNGGNKYKNFLDKGLELKGLGRPESYKEPECMKIVSACFYTDDTIIYSTSDSLKLVRLRKASEVKNIYVKSVTHLLTLKKEKWVVASSTEKTFILDLVYTENEQFSYKLVASFLHEPISFIAELSNDRLVSCFREGIEINSLEIPFDGVWYAEERVLFIFETKSKKYFISVNEAKIITVFDNSSYLKLNSWNSKSKNLNAKNFFSLKDDEIIIVSDDLTIVVLELPSFKVKESFGLNGHSISSLRAISSFTYENKLFFFLCELNKTLDIYCFNSKFQLKIFGFNLYFSPKKMIFQGKYFFFWKDDELGWMESKIITG